MPIGGFGTISIILVNIMDIFINNRQMGNTRIENISIMGENIDNIMKYYSTFMKFLCTFIITKVFTTS